MGNRWGEGLRVLVPLKLGMGPPVHVRTQMAHVDALHLRRGREGYGLWAVRMKGTTTNLTQTRDGLDLRPSVRWHEVHFEILEDFRETAERFGVTSGTREFDKRRRRLS